MAKVAAYIVGRNGLAQTTVPLMADGARVYGDHVTVMSDKQFVPSHVDTYKLAIFWGYVETCQAIMAAYSTTPGCAAVYLDLGYWMRANHYKVSVNARHPTAYFQKVQHGNERRRKFVPTISPYRVRDHILVAGLSPKGAWAEKIEPVGSWEANAIAQIRKYTDRPIIYRPKPTWVGAPKIQGTIFSPSEESSTMAIAKSMSVVTYHSNVGVDGLVDGTAVFSTKGVASVMGTSDLSLIESPIYPDNREQFLNDVAYCQWSIEEMGNGTCWRHLKDEGLIP